MTSELDVRVFWNAPDDMIAFFHGGAVGMSMVPEGIQSLVGTPIANQLVMVVKVRDETGAEIGLLTEMENFSDADEFEVYSMLVIASRGTIVTRQTKNRAVLLKPFQKVIDTGEDWSGEMTIDMTCGPIDQSWGEVIAATDEFQGMTGCHRQRMTFREITTSGSTGQALEQFVLSPRQGATVDEVG